MGRRKWLAWILAGGAILALLTVFSIPPAHTQGSPSTESTPPTPKKTTVSKGNVGGIMGDPARKRGLELGFDMGKKAGKADKDQGKKADPQTHPEFNDPRPFYRYEYGSFAGFASGFRSGFLGGYKTAYGGDAKIKLTSPTVKSSGTTKTEGATGPATPSSATTPKVAKPAAPKTKPSKPDAASDAL